MANGCIRVYSGLMDMMTDNEVEGVLGHEMGHVALGHTRKAMQLAYATTAARTAAASVGGVIGSLSQSQLGEMGEKLVNAQFSQTQESQADDYSYDLMKKRNIDQWARPPALKSWRRWNRDVRVRCLTRIPPLKRAQRIFVSELLPTVSNPASERACIRRARLAVRTPLALKYLIHHRAQIQLIVMQRLFIHVSLR